MTSGAGLPSTPPQVPPLSRARKELFIALAALPVLLAAGVYIGGRLAGSEVGVLEPAAGIASPLVTVEASPPRPLVTVKPATPKPVVTVKPPAPSPVVTVKPPAPATTPPTQAPPAPPVLGPVAPADPPAGPVAVLGRGSTGADVQAWQERMARRGWRIRVDGIFGPQSERVARQFQRNKGLRVDGLVGRQTWNAAWRLPVIR